MDTEEGTLAPTMTEKAKWGVAASNLDPGMHSSPLNSCSFSALDAVPLGHLAKVAEDSSIIFRGEKGSPMAQIAAIQALEVLNRLRSWNGGALVLLKILFQSQV